MSLAVPRALRAFGDATKRLAAAGLRRVHVAYVILAVVFAASRIYYRSAYGLVFDTKPFTYFLQYIPTWFLEHDFWRSILYLHHQAPLQNILVGGVWRVVGEPACYPVLDAIYMAMGFTFGVTLLATMRRLGINTILATIATCTFVAFPVIVEFEMWLFYHTPVITFMMLGTWGLLCFYESGRLRTGVFAFAMFATVALFRNIYGPLWMAVTAGILLVRPPPSRRPGRSPRVTVILAAVFPILFVAANNYKTKLLVNADSADALVSENLVHKMWQILPAVERERLQREGLVTPAVNFVPFENIENMKILRVPHEPTGVPLLDMEMTPTGQRNHHAIEIVLIAQKYFAKDAKYLVEHYPMDYLRSVENGLTDWYMSSPTRDMIFNQTSNFKKMKRVERALGKIGGADRNRRQMLLVVGLPFLFLYGAYRALRARALVESERSTFVTILFMLMTIAYVTFGTNLVSFGDFARYRFEVDPFNVILFTLLLQQLGSAAVSAVRGLRQREASVPAAVPA